LYNGQNVIVVFMDLNHFKEINDTRGHKVGDIALSSFAAGIRKTFGREHCYRYGGDEFLVLLKTSDIIDDKAEVSITQGLEEKLSECTAIELPGLDLRVTAACGYVYGFAANEQKIAAMVIQADSNVYIAKSRRDGMFIGSQFTP
ncbi:MAG: GGDEF domain-containing protein, partial [Oribacterium sp.]|nr:GGDEF domain-containing protein [Oribacterium sp.]